MAAYNWASGLWDWCHLGLFDALDARSGNGVGSIVPAVFRLDGSAFKEFYWYAMELARRAEEAGHDPGA